MLLTAAAVLDTADLTGRHSFRFVLDLIDRLIDDPAVPLDGVALSLAGPVDYEAGSYEVLGSLYGTAV